MIFKRFINLIWNFFCSLNLTIIILIIIGFACLVGMFFDQTLPINKQLNNFSTQIIINIFILFEIYDVFHSWWFGVAILILALNLIACSIQRLPPILFNIRRSTQKLDDNLLNKIYFKHKIKNKKQDNLKKILYNIFSNKDLISNNLKKSYWFKQKHKYARLGVYVIHTALLFIIFGSILTTNLGIDGFMTIDQGKSNSIVKIKTLGLFFTNHVLDFRVKCTNFRLNTFIDGSPMSYESDLEIYDPKNSKKPILHKTIYVNNPLDYNGYTFYQASYMPISNKKTIKLAIGIHGQKKFVYNLNIGDVIKMIDGSKFIPIEAIANYNNLGSALKLKKIKPNGDILKFIIFREYARFDELARRGNFDVVFQGFLPKYSTGLSVSKTPFINIVFLGFILLFIGFYMAFVMKNKRYYARILFLKEENIYELTIALWTNKNKLNLIDEFEKIKSLLK